MTNHTISEQLTQKQLEQYKKDFLKDKHNKLLMNAISRNNLQEIALNREVLSNVDFCFSHEIETPDVTDQARANTCWLFADLNWLRTFVIKQWNIKQFEFSESYLMFYDKLEKANYFLENIINLRTRQRSDRLISFLLDNPNPDGGEWHMTANLIEKYGAIPKSVMHDTYHRENSRHINEILEYVQRQAALQILTEAKKGATEKELQALKMRTLAHVYRILALHFGVPPETFDWAYRDENKKFHRIKNITPQAFFKKFVNINFDDVFSLLNSPSDETPFYRTYTVDYFNNMQGARTLHYLNIPLEPFKKTAVKVLRKGQACLFGADVRYESHTKEGILDADLYRYDQLFGVDFAMDKGSRMDSLHARLTHAMVFSGVDLIRNRPVKWKVENSWGDKVGKKGFFIMSDSWFDEYVYDLIVLREHVDQDLIPYYDQEPIHLPPWHPLG